MKKNITHFGLMLIVVTILAGLFVWNQYDDSDVDYWVSFVLITLIVSVPTSAFFYMIYYWLFRPASVTYIIKKGSNYSQWYYRFRIFLVTQKPFKVEVTLHKSCEVYTDGIQKIFGLGDFNHHVNSFRYGFRWNGAEYDLYTYEYFKGHRLKPSMAGSFKANKKITIYFDEDIVNKFPKGKFLFPYFEQDGRNELGAPQDMRMTLTIKRL